MEKKKLKTLYYFCPHMYTTIRNFLFLFDPEKVHTFSMNALQFICSLPFGKKLLLLLFRPKKNNLLQVSFLGIAFDNPIGLGAGFDKNASYLNELEALGFGFVEIGTVTPKPQTGNELPRLFRLPKDKALINRMGFNNEGVMIIKERLKQWQKKKKNSNDHFRMAIGGNIGKNKVTPNEEAWRDYVACYNELHDYVDYFVVNVSSPNTPGLRALQEKESLRIIIQHLRNQDYSFTVKKPLLLKIAPDLTTEQVDEVIELALEIELDGLVVANTTIDRDTLSTSQGEVAAIGAGGLSGLPLAKKSTSLIDYIHTKTKGKIPLVASGGVFTGADANAKLQAGASLVQVWTGFVYEGPSIVKNICQALA